MPARLVHDGTDEPGGVRLEGRGLAIDEPTRSTGAGLALFALAPRLTRLENVILREVEPALTFRQYRILQRVAEGRTTLTALGRLATITLPAVSESVDVIVRKQLLRRRTDEGDRRAVYLELTPAGERALEQGTRLLALAAETILADVPADRRDGLEADVRSVIDRVTAALIESRDRDSTA